MPTLPQLIPWLVIMVPETGANRALSSLWRRAWTFVTNAFVDGRIRTR